MFRSNAGSFRLFRAFGIDVFLHWSWFLIALIQFQIAVNADPQTSLFSNPVWHAGLYIALFAIVTMHEFGHALACRQVGGRAERIVLWPLGGVAFVNPPQRPGAVLWSIVAGPLVNVALVPVTIGLLLLTESAAPDNTNLIHFVQAITVINGVLLAFNMLPVYPLDGGQTLHAILWFFLGRVKSLYIAASIGLVVAIVGGAVALLFDWWLVIMAIFVGFQAFNGLRVARALGEAERQGYQIESPLPGSASATQSGYER